MPRYSCGPQTRQVVVCLYGQDADRQVVCSYRRLSTALSLRSFQEEIRFPPPKDDNVTGFFGYPYLMRRDSILINGF